MIHSDLLRQLVLVASGTSLLGFAVLTAMRPASFAPIFGYKLDNGNALNEFHATYVGILSGQGIISIWAAVQIAQPIWGDLAAVFLLSQIGGRIIGYLRGGRTSGMLNLLIALELVSGLLLLLIRPGGG